MDTDDRVPSDQSDVGTARTQIIAVKGELTKCRQGVEIIEHGNCDGRMRIIFGLKRESFNGFGQFGPALTIVSSVDQFKCLEGRGGCKRCKHVNFTEQMDAKMQALKRYIH